MNKKIVITGAVTAVIALFLVGFGIMNFESQYKNQTAKAKSSSKPGKASSAITAVSKNLGKTAYLTFDDGPSKYTTAILAALKQNNVNATFFVQVNGEDTAQKRELMKQEVESGNEVEIHSFTHKYSYVYANEQNFLIDFNRIRSIIEEATGTKPKFMRFPGGLGNTVSINASQGKLIMPKLVADVENSGVTPIDWNAGGEDADGTAKTKDQIVQKIFDDINSLKDKNSVIILLHDAPGHQTSVDAISDIVPKLETQGYEFKIISSSTQIVQERFAKSSRRYPTPATYS